MNSRPDLYNWVAKQTNVGSVIEIGVLEGLNALQLAQAFKPQRLVLVDPWGVEDISASGGTLSARSSKQGDWMLQQTKDKLAKEPIPSVEYFRNLSADVLPTLPDNSFDVAYIDGDHTHHGALYDLEACYRIVRPGGFILCHDYRRYDDKLPQIQVVSAVHLFLRGKSGRMSIQRVTYEDFPSIAMQVPAAK